MDKVDAVAREMVRKDIPQVLMLSKDNMASIIYESWGVLWDDNDLLKLLLHNSTYNEVFEVENKIIAYYSIEIRDSILFINSIQVSRGCRGLGYGNEMMKRIEDIAKVYHAEVIELWVQKTNVAARKFYYSRGFKMITRQGNNYLMRKSVSQSH